MSYPKGGYIVETGWEENLEDPDLWILDCDVDYRLITYCTAGIASSSVPFAMALMGYDHASVYDGSLLEWAADPALPMEVPARR